MDTLEKQILLQFIKVRFQITACHIMIHGTEAVRTYQEKIFHHPNRGFSLLMADETIMTAEAEKHRTYWLSN